MTAERWSSVDAPEVTPWPPQRSTVHHATTGELPVPTTEHSATHMKDGKVIVAGGWNDDKISNASYLFDPVDGKWRSVERTLRKRRGHSAVALADGRVRITGGWDGSGFLETAEIYDPAKNHWNKIGPMV